MNRIICHWTAGGHRASALDRQHYHFIVEGDGTVIPGVFPVEANRNPKPGAYAAHTLKCNSGSIGVSMACMAGAKESPFDAGRAPMTRAQWDAMCAKVAELAVRYSIPVRPDTVLSHAEVQGTLKIRQRGKWDFTRLPPFPDLAGAKACGDRLRADVRAAMARIEEAKTPPARIAALSPEVEAALADGDKADIGSTTNLAALAAAGSAAAPYGLELLGLFTNEWVRLALVAIAVAAALWIIRERRRKRTLARGAKAALGWE